MANNSPAPTPLSATWLSSAPSGGRCQPVDVGSDGEQRMKHKLKGASRDDCLARLSADARVVLEELRGTIVAAAPV